MCVCAASATALWVGEALGVRVHGHPVWTSARVTELSWQRRAPVTVTPTGPGTTARQVSTVTDER